MTLEEKIIELQSITPPLSREEIIAEVEKFKASQPKVGVDKFAEESAKQEGVVEQTDATVTPEQTPDASESEDMVSQQETGSSVSPEEISDFSLFQDDPISKETKQGMLDFYNKAVNLSIERSQQPQAQIAEEFTKVAKPGEVYTPGDGYEYKYEINDEGKGVYLTREEGTEDFTEATGTAALAIAGEFGHANFDKEAYFAQVKADEAQLRELNDLNNQVKESTPLTQSVTVEQDFVSTADRWRNLERITKEKADIAQGEGIFDEKKKSVTFKKADTKGELTRDKFETDEDFKAYKDWKKLEDNTAPYTDSKGNYKPKIKEGVSRAEFEQAKKEGRRANYTPTFGYSVQEKGTPTEQEWNKAMQEKLALEAKLDEGVDVETKMGFFGESKVISISQIEPNPQAVNEFNAKYIAPTGSANSESSGIDFSKLQDNKALFEKLQETIGLAVNDDPVIKKKYLELQLKAKPLINKKAAELQEKYDVNTPEGNAKYQEELETYAKSLTQDKLINSDEYKQRINQISSVANAAFAAANNKYKRSEDTFLSTLDGIRGVYDNIPIFDDINEIGADFAEGVVKGSYQIGTGIDKAQMSYDASRVKEASEKIKGINDLISKGRITEDTLVNYRGKMIPAKEAKQKYELEKKDWRKALENNLDEVIESEGYTALFKAADLSDGISLSDVVLTTAEALPQIGLATAGTLAAAASGGTLAPAIFGALGTVTMFGTMYGDAYLEAARTGAIEDYEAENGKGSWADLSEKEQNLLLADGLEDGRYHDPGKAAVTAAVQTAMERFGANKILAKTQKALGVGKNGLASIIAGDIRQFGKNLVSGGLAKIEAGLTEFATEYGQEVVGAIGKGLTVAGPGGANRYVDLSAAWEAGKAGGIVGVVMPFAGSIKSQATIEIRNLARNVAINFAPDSKFGSAAKANAKFFREAQKELDKRLASGNITKEQHLDESISIANIKNASDKIPTGTDTQTREKLIDLMVKRDQLERTIENVGDKDLTEEEQQELNETKEELRDVISEHLEMLE
jgi:hypothetical protein